MMHRLLGSLLVSVLLGAVLTAFPGSSAFAQKSEPLPPGSDNAPDNEAPPRYIPPPQSYQSALAPTDPSAITPRPPGAKFDPRDWQNAISVYGRYLFVTTLMLKPYLSAATKLNGWATGMQYTRRYDHFDVVTTLDFSWLQLDNGNYLAKGNDPSTDTKYVWFDKLSMLSVDVAIVGHHAFNNWLEIRGGAGLGIGAVFGKVYSINDSGLVCNSQTAPHIAQCYPIVQGATPAQNMPILLGTPQTNSQLRATQNSSELDTADHPHLKNSFKPPVMGVLDVFLALNFRLHRHVSLQAELGFRDAMFAGANLMYHF